MNAQVRRAGAVTGTVAALVLVLPGPAGAEDRRPEFSGVQGPDQSFRLGPEDYPPSSMYPSGSLSGSRGGSSGGVDAGLPVIVPGRPEETTRVDDEAQELLALGVAVLAGGVLGVAVAATAGPRLRPR